MAQKIRWSVKALNDRREILQYWVFRNKSTTYSKKLNKAIVLVVDSILKYPNLGILTDKRHVRFRVLKDYQIFYQEKGDCIEIITIWDSRRNPKGLNF